MSSPPQQISEIQRALDDVSRAFEESLSPPPAREHSYLSSPHSVYIPLNNVERPAVFELPVLELDIVVFPGDTLPIRLKNNWIGSEQLNAARRGESELLLGIITKRRNDDVVRPRNSWTRQSLGPRRLTRIAQQLASVMRQYESDDVPSEVDSEFEVTGASTHADTRIAQGESSDSEVDSDFEIAGASTHADTGIAQDESSDSVMERNEATEPLLRSRDEAVAVESENHSRSHLDPESRRPQRRRVEEISLRRIGLTRRRPPSVEQPRVQLNDNERDDDFNAAFSVQPTDFFLFARPRANDFIFQLEPGAYSMETTPQRSASDDIGRIGTIVTVIYTHGDSDMQDASQSSHRTREALPNNGQLVMTAVGTSRFRIIARCDDDRNNSTPVELSSKIRTFVVEEIKENPLELPYIVRCDVSLGGNLSETHSLGHHRRLVSRMALVSPLPEFVQWHFWPWRLAAAIREALHRVPAYKGVAASLPTFDESLTNAQSRSMADPHYFSYWLASNLPFKQQEKLNLLECISTIERLLFILNKIQTLERTEAILQCRNCGIPLSKAKHLFTVGGAEGTTGNYVNEHGYVHQTSTVRKLDEMAVIYSGGPQSRDSWFPGYAWTIMSCQFCMSHLGWKFTSIGGEDTPDRPSFFFGLSAGSFSTHMDDNR